MLRELHVERDVYLMDVRTSRVFTNALGSDWPELVGTWDGTHINFLPSSSAVNLFQRLDRYLKEGRVRFKDLFGQFDRGSKGYLSPGEMRQFIQELMPEVAEGDLKYFQVCVGGLWESVEVWGGGKEVTGEGRTRSRGGAGSRGGRCQRRQPPHGMTPTDEVCESGVRAAVQAVGGALLRATCMPCCLPLRLSLPLLFFNPVSPP